MSSFSPLLKFGAGQSILTLFLLNWDSLKSQDLFSVTSCFSLDVLPWCADWFLPWHLFSQVHKCLTCPLVAVSFKENSQYFKSLAKLSHSAPNQTSRSSARWGKRRIYLRLLVYQHARGHCEQNLTKLKLISIISHCLRRLYPVYTLSFTSR